MNKGTDASGDNLNPTIKDSRDSCRESNVRTCVLFLAVALSGCGVATGPKFSGLEDPQSDEAILYVYRTGLSPQASLMYPCVFIDGEKKDALKVDGYLMYRIAPQRTEVRLAECSFFSPGSGGLRPPETFLIDALPSMRYYIKYDQTVHWTRAYQEVSEEVALPEIQRLKRTN